MNTEFTGIMQQMAILFSIMAVGYGANKAKIMGREFDKGLCKLVLNVSLPAMILASVLNVSELPSRSDIMLTLGLAFVAYLLMTGMAYLFVTLTRVPAGWRGVFKFMVVFGNTGFLGFPVVAAIFGNDAVIFASICNLPFNILVFTVGAWFMRQDNQALNIAKNNSEKDSAAKQLEHKTTTNKNSTLQFSPRTLITPAVIACLFAIVFALTGICDVPFIGPALNTLGGFTTPAAMLIVGSAMANMPLRHLLGSPRLFALAAVRLLITPSLVYLIMSPLVSNPLLLGVLVVTCGMPVATNGTILCYEYGADVKTVSQGTFITTVGSLISVPFLILLLG